MRLGIGIYFIWSFYHKMNILSILEFYWWIILILSRFGIHDYILHGVSSFYNNFWNFWIITVFITDFFAKFSELFISHFLTTNRRKSSDGFLKIYRKESEKIVSEKNTSNSIFSQKRTKYHKFYDLSLKTGFSVRNYAKKRVSYFPWNFFLPTFCFTLLPWFLFFSFVADFLVQLHKKWGQKIIYDFIVRGISYAPFPTFTFIWKRNITCFCSARHTFHASF